MHIITLDIDLIRRMVSDMRKDVTLYDILELQEKYKYLYKHCPTLFNMVLKDRPEFEANVDMMLTYIKKIQDQQITQDDASKIVGTVVAKQFFPKDLL